MIIVDDVVAEDDDQTNDVEATKSDEKFAVKKRLKKF